VTETGAQAARPAGSSVEHSIEIQVPAEFVWEMLEDVGSWSSWNPIYVKASGSIGVGDSIAMLVVLPRMKPHDITAKVSRSIVNSQLHYGSPALGGLIRATRYVEISPTGPNKCIVTNGEVMGGLVGRFLARSVGPRIREGLQQMNEGLKQAAEAKWRERGQVQPRAE
jgi:hypothetical protein